MPKVGVNKFPHTVEGIAEAESYSEATGVPMTNAQDRSEQTYFHGGKVQGDQLPTVDDAGLGQPQTGILGQLGAPSVSPVGDLGQPQMGTRGFNKGGKATNKKNKGV